MELYQVYYTSLAYSFVWHCLLSMMIKFMMVVVVMTTTTTTMMIWVVLVVVSGHRETLKLIAIHPTEIQNCGRCWCGKLSNQAPSEKSSSMAHATVLPSNCGGNRVDWVKPTQSPLLNTLQVTTDPRVSPMPVRGVMGNRQIMMMMIDAVNNNDNDDDCDDDDFRQTQKPPYSINLIFLLFSQKIK